jgi:chromosome segregation ATPase
VAQPNDVSCPKCQHLLSIAPEQRGDAATCPQCGYTFEPGRAQPLLSILQQLEELQQELTRSPPPSPAPRMPLSSEVQLQVSTPAAQAIVGEQIDRLTKELDGVRGERDRLHARQQAMALESAQLRIVVSEFEQAQSETAAARLTAIRALARALDGARLRWEDERKSLGTQAQERERALTEELEHRIKTEQEQASGQIEELRRESAQEREVLQKALDELRQQHATKSEEYQALSKLRAEMETAHQERERHWQARHDELQRDLEQHQQAQQSRHDEWQTQLERYQQEQAALRKEVAAHQQQQQALREEVERHKREREAAVEHHDALSTEWDELTARHEKVQTALQELEERFASESGDFGHELEQIREERDEAHRSRAELEREVTDLRSRHSQQTQSEQDNAARLARLQKDLESVYQGHQQQQSALSEAEERLRAEQEKSEAERRKTQHEIDEARRLFEQESDTLQQELRRLRQDWDSAITHRESLTQERQTLVQRHGQLETAHQDLEARFQKETTSLREALDKAERELGAAAHRNDELVKQLEARAGEVKEQSSRDSSYQLRVTELEEELVAAAQNQRQAQAALHEAELQLGQERESAAEERRSLEAERKTLHERVESTLAQAEEQLAVERERTSTELHEANVLLEMMRQQMAEQKTAVGSPEAGARAEAAKLEHAMAEIHGLRQKLDEALVEHRAELHEAEQRVQAERQRAGEDVRQNKELLDMLRRQVEEQRAGTSGESEGRLAAERRRAQEQAETMRQQYEQERAALYQELHQLRQNAASSQPATADRHTHLDAFWASEANRGEGRMSEEFAPRPPAANRPSSENRGAMSPDVQTWAAAGLSAEVERLSRQMGSDSVPDQSAASRRFDAVGPAALGPLAAASNSPDPIARRGAGRALLLLGDKFKKAGQLAQAKEAYRLALPLFSRIVGEEPGVAEYRWRLADCYFSYGSLAGGPNQLQEAEESYRKAAELSERLTADFPDVQHYRRALALSQNNLGIILARTNRGTDAEQSFTTALKHQEKLLTEQPTQSLYKFDLALTYLNWGTLLANTDRAAQAEDAYRRAKGLGEHLMAEQPQSADFRNILTTANNNLGKLTQKKQTTSG